MSSYSLMQMFYDGVCEDEIDCLHKKGFPLGIQRYPVRVG